MNEDSMPTPCADCGNIVDFRYLTDDPMEEHDMVCERCAYHREEIKRAHEEEMQAYDYEHRMPEYQKHIR